MEVSFNDLLLPTRDELGREVSINGKNIFKWSNENLVGIDLGENKFHLFYDSSGALLAACPTLKNVTCTCGFAFANF
ncbi:MAG: hypothetical protein HQK52_23285 [Oligoflexia bacterium]|nr:hypothetical protein [Oligoflexia bacterium]